jgi:hypothetical protein
MRQAREHPTVPRIGDRVERVRAGVSKRGKVHYADELQALVKWDDGSSSSVRLDHERLKVIEPRRRALADGKKALAETGSTSRT